MQLSSVFYSGKTKPSNKIRFNMWIGWVKNPRSMEATKKERLAHLPSLIYFQLLINWPIMPAYAPMLEVPIMPEIMPA